MATLLIWASGLGGCIRIPKDGELAPISVCELAKDLAAHRGQLLAVRGVYYDGLRQKCPQTCAIGEWPSFLALIGPGYTPAGERPAGFATDDESWVAVDRADQVAQREAGQGRKLEVWVTVVGRLRTRARLSPLAPCDKIGSWYYGYGHMGAYPGELVVKRFTDIEIRSNPHSPYDYAILGAVRGAPR